ncbi:MAG: triose-phosphate isomerase [bacterium]
MPTRTKFIAGNWKMFPATGSEALELLRQLRVKLAPFSKTQIAVCPPCTALYQAAEILKSTRIELGAQNLHWEDTGAYTGEISAPMLKAVGCKFVIIGHSERREHFGETNQNVHRKTQAALKHDLTPIVCVGETLEQREAGVFKEVVREQVTEAFREMSTVAMQKIVIAYEPVWAIGTGRTATPAQAQEMQLFIRDLLAELFNQTVADAKLILYGGSVKPENARELLRQPDIDGALVGGASLNAQTFAEIVRSGEELI